MTHYDFIVIGAGVIGASVAHHLAAQGAQSVLVIERGTIGAGTTSQSSGLLRTHYSVRQNVELARSSWWAFNNFAEYVGDDEASCGLVKCGYLICSPEGDKLEPLRASLDTTNPPISAYGSTCKCRVTPMSIHPTTSPARQATYTERSASPASDSMRFRIVSTGAG